MIKEMFGGREMLWECGFATSFSRASKFEHTNKHTNSDCIRANFSELLAWLCCCSSNRLAVAKSCVRASACVCLRGNFDWPKPTTTNQQNAHSKQTRAFWARPATSSSTAHTARIRNWGFVDPKCTSCMVLDSNLH